MVEKKVSKKKVTKGVKKKSINKKNNSKIQEDKLIVSEKEIEKDLKDKPAKEEYVDDNPSWYHYVIVLLVFFGGFYLIYLGFEFFEDDNQTIIHTQTYKYPYVVGNITYNIYFHSPLDEIKKLNYPIEVDKYDIFKSKDLRFSFKEYNGTDNGEVTRSSTKLLSFLKLVFLFDFDENEAFVYYNETNCSNSSSDHIVVVFDPYQDKTGVFKDENSCIQIYSDDPYKLVALTDSFIYSLIQNE